MDRSSPADPAQTMWKTKTLVHKGAMPMARESIRTFTQIRRPPGPLEVHSDGSLDEADWRTLEEAAGDVPVLRVAPSDRQHAINEAVAAFPRVAGLLRRGGYMAKMHVLAAESEPFFYFDSDILWLRSFDLVPPSDRPAAFSTETWSWYYGMQSPWRWIRERIPWRVNSGFAWIVPPFPFQRFEMMLVEGLYTPDHLYSTDQEILAFLFPNALAFRFEDFGRSRVGIRYHLADLPQIAMHFPGGMWKPHLTDIQKFAPGNDPVRNVRFDVSGRLTALEVARMEAALLCEKNPLLQRLANGYRRFRRRKFQSP